MCVLVFSLYLPGGNTESSVSTAQRGRLLGFPAANQEALGADGLHPLSPRNGSLPVGYIAKLVLLLNGKAREILAKH